MIKRTLPFGKKTRLALLVASSLAFSGLASAQVTSSSIRGQVVDTQGNPVSGVEVEVLHTPTGSRKTLTTSENGVFQSGGMTVGGPYEVKLINGSSYQAQTISDLFLRRCNDFLGSKSIFLLSALIPPFRYHFFRAL